MGVVLMPAAISDAEIFTPTTYEGGTAYALQSPYTLFPAGPMHLNGYSRLAPVSWTNLVPANILSGITAAINNGQTDLISVNGTAGGGGLRMLTFSGVQVAATLSAINVSYRSNSGAVTHDSWNTRVIDISAAQLDGLDPKFVYAMAGGTYYYGAGGVMYSSSVDGSTSVGYGYRLDDYMMYYELADNNGVLYCDATNGIRMPVERNNNLSPHRYTDEFYVYVIGV